MGLGGYEREGEERSGARLMGWRSFCWAADERKRRLRAVRIFGFCFVRIYDWQGGENVLEVQDAD